MALYCTVCRCGVSGFSSICTNCKTGFTAQLYCGTCGGLVERGLSYCTSCDQGLTRTEQGSSGDGGGLLPLVPFGAGMGAPIPAPYIVPKSYQHGRFGVSAEVTMNGQDAEILTLMSQAATLLHGLAAKMNQFQGVMKSTRDCIRGCRDLASTLQEEIEIRRGPQG